MRTLARITATFAAFCSHHPALAQIGTPDQSSPNGGWLFSLRERDWQQQVRAGVSGQLAGIVISLVGTPTSSAIIEIRLGPAWNQAWPSYSMTLSPSSNQEFFVDLTGSNIWLSAGDVFVIGTRPSGGLGCSIMGNRATPPLYPEP